jgi:hypothetical protein
VSYLYYPWWIVGSSVSASLFIRLKLCWSAAGFERHLYKMPSKQNCLYTLFPLRLLSEHASILRKTHMQLVSLRKHLTASIPCNNWIYKQTNFLFRIRTNRFHWATCGWTYHLQHVHFQDSLYYLHGCTQTDHLQDKHILVQFLLVLSGTNSIKIV